MENTLTMQMNNKYWWIQMLLGIAFIGFGLWLWYTPAETYIRVVFLFSTWMFATGIFEIINAFDKRKYSKQWGTYLIGGIVDLVIGGILMLHENLTLEILPLFLGFWLLFRTLMLIVMYFELKNNQKRPSVLLFILAIFLVTFALIIIAKPIFGELVIVYTIAFSFLFIGVYYLISGNFLRKLKN